MAAYICSKCGEKSWNVSLVSSMYRCPNCMKFYHGGCLENKGVGVLRRGNCPYCGAEIHLSHRVGEAGGNADGDKSGPNISPIVIIVITALILFAIGPKKIIKSCSQRTGADMTKEEILEEGVMCSNGENVNLRSCASKKCETLTQLMNGDRVKVKGYENGWVQVNSGGGGCSDGTTGFVSRELLSPCR